MKGTESSRMPPTHPTHTDSPTVNTPHQSGTFMPTDEPTLTHHHYPKSPVDVRVHSWGHTSYEFGQIYNDT